MASTWHLPGNRACEKGELCSSPTAVLKGSGACVGPKNEDHVFSSWACNAALEKTLPPLLASAFPSMQWEAIERESPRNFHPQASVL